MPIPGAHQAIFHQTGGNKTESFNSVPCHRVGMISALPQFLPCRRTSATARLQACPRDRISALAWQSSRNPRNRKE